MSEPLTKAKAACAAAKDLIGTPVDDKGDLPIRVDLDISRLLAVAGVQAAIAQAEALEGILLHLREPPEDPFARSKAQAAG